MSGMTKTIKYLAIAFALFLAFSIISGIMYSVLSLSNVFNDNDNQAIAEELHDLEINDNTLLLDIDVLGSNIIIKQGDVFKAETNNKYIKTKQDKNRLYIEESGHKWFHNSNNSELIIYVPNNFVFDAVSVETGAGKVNVERLTTKKLYFDLGAGKAKINNLMVLEDAKIDGGAGEISIDAISINDLDLDMGMGKLSLKSKLTGKNKIDSGVGELNLSIVGSLEDYEITLDKGVGSATLDGKTMIDESTYGSGMNKLDIDGGVGSININFIEE